MNESVKVNPVGPNGPELAELQVRLDSAMLRGASGHRVARLPGGTALRKQGLPFQTQRRGSSAASSANDWRVSPSATPGNFSVYPSTINQVVATNWHLEVSAGPTGTWFIHADATVTGGLISSVSLAATTALVGAPPVTPGAPPITFEFLIAIVVDGTVVYQCANKPVLATVQEVYRAGKAAPSPGEYPLDIYYTWALTQP